MRNLNRNTLLVAFAFLLLGLFLITLPPVRDRILYRFDQARVRVYYALNPPEEAVFVPQAQVETIVQATFLAMTPSPIFTETPSPMVTLEPTQTPTPLPASYQLQGVRYEDQHGLWNYCAPASLSMALSYWGWQGTRLDTGSFLKPYEKDKNVMPYEMVNYIQSQTGLGVALRYGGTPRTLKSLVVNGFPVLIEKGTFIREASTGKVSWMGHYNVITGYDDATQEYIVQDSYYSADYRIPYVLLEREWRSFNNVFLVVYPSEQQAHLYDVLGPLATEAGGYLNALSVADQEMRTLSGIDRFFALFNRGSSLVLQNDYVAAAAAFDEAFAFYPSLTKEERPWRMMWYQTGPYFAYFYTGRHQDVIDLASTTISSANEPFLEENFYWRAKSKLALGDTQGAQEDLCKSLEYHPDFGPTLAEIQSNGFASCS